MERTTRHSAHGILNLHDISHVLHVWEQHICHFGFSSIMIHWGALKVIMPGCAADGHYRVLTSRGFEEEKAKIGAKGDIAVCKADTFYTLRGCLHQHTTWQNSRHPQQQRCAPGSKAVPWLRATARTAFPASSSERSSLLPHLTFSTRSSTGARMHGGKQTSGLTTVHMLKVSCSELR